VEKRMEFESKIASFASGLFLAGSYMILFGLWEYSSLLMAVSLILLLLIAFRDHRPRRAEAIGLLASMSLFIIFLKEFDNSTLFPLTMLLLCSLIALSAKPEAFLPPLAGLLCMQFIDTSFLVRGFTLIFLNLSPLLGIRYGINDLGYIILYHSQTKLPIAIDDIKLLLPFYLAVVVAQIALLALLKIDSRAVIKQAFLSIAIVFLFVILAMKNLIAVRLLHHSSPTVYRLWPSLLPASLCYQRSCQKPVSRGSRRESSHPRR
jgi:hypothetical protein